MQLLALSVLVAGAAYADSENLLNNPGFEAVAGDGSPESWDLFLMPMEGAFGRLSIEAGPDGRSVTIFVPEPYSVDPANNWSQVVYGEFAGKTLSAAARIRTEEAGGAALWIQCFQRSPVRVLATGSSADEHPIAGTNEWTSVSTAIQAPESTSYVVVRCVLQGYGRVWFDDLSLTASGDGGLQEPENAATTADTATASDIDDIRNQMRSAIDSVEKSNRALLVEIEALQSEVSSLRAGVDNSEVAPESTDKHSNDTDELGRQLETGDGGAPHDASQPASLDVPRNTNDTRSDLLRQFELVRQEIQATLDGVRTSNEILQARLEVLSSELEDLRNHFLLLGTDGEAVEQLHEQSMPRHILIPRDAGVEP